MICVKKILFGILLYIVAKIVNMQQVKHLSNFCKDLVDDLVIMCAEIMDTTRTVLKYFNETCVNCKTKDLHILLAFLRTTTAFDSCQYLLVSDLLVTGLLISSKTKTSIPYQDSSKLKKMILKICYKMDSNNELKEISIKNQY